MDQTRPAMPDDPDEGEAMVSEPATDPAAEAGDLSAAAPVSEPGEVAQDDAPADVPAPEESGVSTEAAQDAAIREQEAVDTVEASPFEPAIGEIVAGEEPAGEEPEAEADAAATEDESGEELGTDEADEPLLEDASEDEGVTEDAAEARSVAEDEAEGTTDDAEESGQVAEADEVEEYDAETAALLAWQPGEWFVVHTYAGYENKVKANLETRITSMNMEDRIYEVVIPMEDVVEMKGGKKQVVQRKVFPGYLLVRMDLDDDSWYVVRNTPGVTGFVGSANKPIPLSDAEVDRILQRGEAAEEERPRPRPEWQVNDPVRVTTGPFANFQGVVSEIDLDRSKLKVLVNIFGRETPVELGFDQVSKV